MARFHCFLICIMITLVEVSCGEINRGGVDYLYPSTNTVSLDGYIHLKQIQQSDHLVNLPVSSPDYYYPTMQVSFAAPVGAQHPNQKPQPEPQPPPYRPRFYYNHSVYINSDIARSYIHSQRTFT